MSKAYDVRGDVRQRFDRAPRMGPLDAWSDAGLDLLKHAAFGDAGIRAETFPLCFARE